MQWKAVEFLARESYASGHFQNKKNFSPLAAVWRRDRREPRVIQWRGSIGGGDSCLEAMRWWRDQGAAGEGERSRWHLTDDVGRQSAGLVLLGSQISYLSNCVHGGGAVHGDGAIYLYLFFSLKSNIWVKERKTIFVEHLWENSFSFWANIAHLLLIHLYFLL